MSRITVNLDCDGVLANFIKGACKAHNKPINESKWNFYEDWGMSEQSFWAKCEGEQFWLDLEPYEYANKFLNKLKLLCVNYDAELTIVTAPSLDPLSISAKIKWLYKYFKITNNDIVLGSKKWLLAHTKSILIDDYQRNIDLFRLNNGHGIIYPRPWNGNINTTKYDWYKVLKQTKRTLEYITSNNE